VDLPLSHVFYRAALGRPLHAADVGSFDPSLHASLGRLATAAAAWRAGGGKGDANVDGVPLADLCLSYALPGYPDYPLRAGVSPDAPLTAATLEAYLSDVLEATLGAGVQAQMTAFRAGFNEVFPLASLEAFYEDEVELLLCGAGEAWTPQLLTESIKFDHGYTPASPPIRFLLEALSELAPADQRRFLRFVTGCPLLPPAAAAAASRPSAPWAAPAPAARRWRPPPPPTATSPPS